MSMSTLFSLINRKVPPVSRPLVVLALGSLGLLLASLVLQLIDPRQVLGASTWLKPVKFGASVAIASVTLALLLGQLKPTGPGVRRAVGIITGTLALELVIIAAQSARGVPSHFNAATVLDIVLFNIMGVAIVVATGAMAYLGWKAFRTPVADRALAWGIGLGFVAMLAGASLGGLMPGPTAAQLQTLKAGQSSPLIGAHTVGAPDGGPGLPVTRWSTEAGDLRIPHFIGLHGLQLLPLLGWWLSRRRWASASPVGATRAARLTLVAGGAYLGLIGVTLLQALRGQPLLAPDGWTSLSAGVLLLVSSVAAVLVARPGLSRHLPEQPAGTSWA